MPANRWRLMSNVEFILQLYSGRQSLEALVTLMAATCHCGTLIMTAFHHSLILLNSEIGLVLRLSNTRVIKHFVAWVLT